MEVTFGLRAQAYGAFCAEQMGKASRVLIVNSKEFFYLSGKNGKHGGAQFAFSGTVDWHQPGHEPQFEGTVTKNKYIGHPYSINFVDHGTGDHVAFLKVRSHGGRPGKKINFPCDLYLAGP